ncbi:MAG: hypothetical protein ABMB14_25060, partial [Myxococcota bacterium]
MNGRTVKHWGTWLFARVRHGRREPEEGALRVGDVLTQAVIVGGWSLLAAFAVVGVFRELTPALLGMAVLNGLVPGPTRDLLAARGWWRVGWVFALLDTWSWGRGSDRRGGAVASLALTLLRHPDDAALAARLDRELAAVTRLGPCSVLAAGIRSFVRGDRDDARRMWRLVGEFDSTVRPPFAAATAIDLLAAEAASLGAFGRMDRELSRPRSPRTAFGALLRRCRRRLAGEPVAERALWLGWLVAGARGPLGALVTRIVAETPSSPAPSPYEPSGPTLRSAVERTVRLGLGPTRREDVAAAAVAWEAALADGGGIPPERVTELREQVVGLLT